MNNALIVRNDLDLMTLGEVLAKSGFFTDSRDAAQAVVKVLAGQELGFGPVASMTGIYIVKGRVTLSANLMAAAVKRSGRYNYRIIEHTDTECAIEFFEEGESVGVSKFTKQDATKAKLSGDNWTKYPRNMLFARAMSNGTKFYCPDIFGGPIYTPDELGAPIDGESGEIVEGNYSVRVDEPSELDAHLDGPEPDTRAMVLARETFPFAPRFKGMEWQEFITTVEEWNNSFWAAVVKLNLEETDVHDALNVESAKDWNAGNVAQLWLTLCEERIALDDIAEKNEG